MKKRILSLILALSMVLSVLPLGAFAEGSTGELVMQGGFPKDSNYGSNSCSGSGWSYETSTGTLYLNSGTYNFSSTQPVQCAIEVVGAAEITGGTFNRTVSNNYGTISDGTFESDVTNDKNINGGNFRKRCSVTNGGTIENGTFEGKVTNNSTISGGTFQNGCIVTNNNTISGGNFKNTCSVTNNSHINDGTFEGNVTNEADGKIFGGTFAANKKVENRGTITDGTFNGEVTNNGTIGKGTFNGEVLNFETIANGTFNGTVENYGGTISSGTFKGTVQNWYGTISGGTFHEKVLNSNGEITGGTFAAGLSANHNTVTGGVFNGKTGLTDALHVTVTNGSVDKVNGVVTTGTAWDLYSYAGTTVTITADTEIYSLNGKPIGAGNCNSSYGVDKKTVKFTMPGENVVLNGAITCTDLVMKKGYPEDSNGGTFEGEVINNDLGVISGGTFHEKVSNYNGMITGGTFKSSVTSKGHGRIFGGVFNGNATLTNVTGLHSITVASGAKIKEVNGMSADWDPYVVVTENATTNEVIITADTEIFSLNGKSIGDGNCKSSYDGSDYKTVKFTMPGEPVVLNGAITCTDLVMEKGWPKASNEGKISCSGTDWSYDHNTKTLTLTSNSGTYDFSLANPQDTTKTTSADSAVACAIVIESGAEITGGTFNGKVTNNAGGTISGGTFQDTCSVTNNGTIKNGTFKDVCSVTNEGANATIENGTFKNMCRVINNSNGTISGGTFKNKCRVENNAGGTISGGTFAGSVSNNGGTVNGGIFNGNTGLDGVTNLHSITVASGAKIEKVNGVSADWAPYVVTSNATTKEVTITADTEIFSLNGQPIAESSYGSDKTTVTFTMPDDDVVLNGAITSTDLVMENGWPKDSNGGTIPCKGDGWEYIPNDPTNGDMLLLTGSNQTGGLFDFSTIGDGSAVECNVFVGKPTAITGGEFNGKVFNNSGILGGTFHGEVDNMGPGTIKGGTFNGAVENNGMIENGAFHDAVENNGTINDGTFHGKVENNSVINSGTFNSSVDNTTMGRIENGTFNDAVENNGTIEKGTFHGEVKNNGTIENGTFHGAVENNGTINGGVFNGAVTGSGTVSESITGSGTLNGEPITKTEPEPEPEPTTYTVTVIGGTIDGKTSVSAKENDTLTVVLDQNDIPDGMTFDLWSISSSKLSGDINVDYRAEAMTFQMPPEDVTIRAQYRSAEIIEDAAPSPLATAATIAVGGAAAGIVVWQGVSLGVDLYLANALPQGVPVPTDRRALALLLWETAGKPEVALPTLYGDIPTEEIELQKATRWAVQNGLMDAADKKDASFFDPDHYVTKMDVFGAWLRLKKLLGTT